VLCPLLVTAIALDLFADVAAYALSFSQVEVLVMILHRHYIQVKIHFDIYIRLPGRNLLVNRDLSAYNLGSDRVLPKERKIKIAKEKIARDDLFLSGSLALDLVNTEMIVRRKKHDILSSPEDLAQWWQAALAHHLEHEDIVGDGTPIAWTFDLLEEVKKFRQSLRSLCTGLVEEQTTTPPDLTMLNQILALGYQSVQAMSQGEIIAVYRVYDPQKGRVLLPIALSALWLLTEAERQRLHKCKNDRCILFFYDTSKGGTRQWCSLGCLNRSRSIYHYQQRKNG
jgi:predicted RNA-binding Zn ribbon-like protein